MRTASDVCSQESQVRKDCKKEEHDNLMIRKDQFTMTGQQAIYDICYKLGILIVNGKIPRSQRFHTQYPNENQDCLQFIDNITLPKNKNKNKSTTNSNNNSNKQGVSLYKALKSKVKNKINYMKPTQFGDDLFVQWTNELYDYFDQTIVQKFLKERNNVQLTHQQTRQLETLARTLFWIHILEANVSKFRQKRDTSMFCTRSLDHYARELNKILRDLIEEETMDELLKRKSAKKAQKSKNKPNNTDKNANNTNDTNKNFNFREELKAILKNNFEKQFSQYVNKYKKFPTNSLNLFLDEDYISNANRNTSSNNNSSNNSSNASSPISSARIMQFTNFTNDTIGINNNNSNNNNNNNSNSNHGNIMDDHSVSMASNSPLSSQVLNMNNFNNFNNYQMSANQRETQTHQREELARIPMMATMEMFPQSQQTYQTYEAQQTLEQQQEQASQIAQLAQMPEVPLPQPPPNTPNTSNIFNSLNTLSTSNIGETQLQSLNGYEPFSSQSIFYDSNLTHTMSQNMESAMNVSINNVSTNNFSNEMNLNDLDLALTNYNENISNNNNNNNMSMNDISCSLQFMSGNDNNMETETMTALMMMQPSDWKDNNSELHIQTTNMINNLNANSNGLGSVATEGYGPARGGPHNDSLVRFAPFTSSNKYENIGNGNNGVNSNNLVGNETMTSNTLFNNDNNGNNDIIGNYGYCSNNYNNYNSYNSSYNSSNNYKDNINNNNNNNDSNVNNYNAADCNLTNTHSNNSNNSNHSKISNSTDMSNSSFATNVTNSTNINENNCNIYNTNYNTDYNSNYNSNNGNNMVNMYNSNDTPMIDTSNNTQFSNFDDCSVFNSLNSLNTLNRGMSETSLQDTQSTVTNFNLPSLNLNMSDMTYNGSDVNLMQTYGSN